MDTSQINLELGNEVDCVTYLDAINSYQNISDQPSLMICEKKHASCLVGGDIFNGYLYHQIVRQRLNGLWKFELSEYKNGLPYYLITDQKHYAHISAGLSYNGHIYHIHPNSVTDNKDFLQWVFLDAGDGYYHICDSKHYRCLVSGNDIDNEIYHQYPDNRDNSKWKCYALWSESQTKKLEIFDITYAPPTSITNCEARSTGSVLADASAITGSSSGVVAKGEVCEEITTEEFWEFSDSETRTQSTTLGASTTVGGEVSAALNIFTIGISKSSTNSHESTKENSRTKTITNGKSISTTISRCVEYECEAGPGEKMLCSGFFSLCDVEIPWIAKKKVTFADGHYVITEISGTIKKKDSQSNIRIIKEKV